MSRHRRLLLLRGASAQTLADARATLARLDPLGVCWIGDHPGAVSPAHARRLLGQGFDTVVLDLHGGLDPDTLGRAQGLVWGGGALVLRMPPAGERPPARSGLALHPFTPADVGHAMWDRLEAAVAGLPEAAPEPLAPPTHAVAATPDQDAAVAALLSAWRGPRPTCVALIADRGRGKSAALGRALRASAAGRVRVVSPDPGSAGEVTRFAGPMWRDRWLATPAAAVALAGRLDQVVVDEAARLPVPVLQRIVEAHPGADLVFSTTTHGYEGSGRGFALRVLPWLASIGRPARSLSLETPIRWAAGDPVEALVRRLLLLDGAPPAPPSRPPPSRRPPVVEPLSQHRLAHDEALLRSTFGLLVDAHYRTTPGDLERVLDAPNLRVHAVRAGPGVAAVNLLAAEGGLTPAQSAAAAAGRGRLRGHALADSLVVHLGRPDAGPLRMLRSVRIATAAAWRRSGLAQALVEAAHATPDIDLFGTVFGATLDVLRFRRRHGYQLVRLGVGRGARTGAPAAVMVWPKSDAARALVRDLRMELALNLPHQRALHSADPGAGDEPGLMAALAAGLPSPEPPSTAALRHALLGYVAGPRTADAVHFALSLWLDWHPGALARLPAADRRLIEARVRAHAAWEVCAQAAGLDSVRAAQRRLRRAFQDLARAAGVLTA